MDRKAERLVLILEGIALLTALILILVDYKLKNDLVELYGKMEVALERGQKLFGENANPGSNSLRVPDSPMVDNVSRLETSDSPSVAGSNGKPKARGTAATRRSGRAGDKAISRTDKPLGP
jgi:hypothetical protein